ncbi:MAG: hypothetical protein A3J07_03335 [Candidatus Doudnabacteria bacterium RIFCSPLOWO2_02_FULL_49_13]|uniref:AAA+ ATPase domain-containing protein n=1 Tax=Candidatus Doudnabacteria bacterium RIFCSPHIGHO2_12_FULL_48_16 TaxID=1817838 RepID=A0A1F5PJ43_9BACT|nr:MAG: hypothetical protein A3B77_02140 [Candidatus Doudnabacteria bacterium RIFCSPHIGHO2_02_FULL_49_24]OGE89354.1 MAG: hypothetical protein A2760_03210 [Candidatus Doudnabacteria bacterium RIFCSPHIGHO2_01_FULL_50_67]OGE89955.1 MAG: hypothetical protein A3E29_02480 [Candidatus Doudnabacteria bacterium RIFCSPHIGHO2_12_FULL_48_16]OGE97500.1 MAG: hypothetical protein A2990_02155 [Candidatus Doudnabacteria bacterium RIFCSPLOWO2_01_FULL_49_40]OGF03096.1 MAG: hypothetical protein A3J07_03335 [Candid
MDWQIIGHKKQLEFLAQSIALSKLAHAYLFAGPAGIGKKAVARRLAQALLPGLEHRDDFFHPDYIEIAQEGEIKIAQIRELVYKLSLKPYSGVYKVAVIDSAHEMNSEAANALLKSLEEPKSQTVIILITSNSSSLPKTIISRVQKINFGALDESEIRQLPALEPAACAKLAEATEYYKKVTAADLADKLILVQDLADWESPDLQVLLQRWLADLQLELRREPSLALTKKISAVAEAQRLLNQNVNSKLLLANLMIKI